MISLTPNQLKINIESKIKGTNIPIASLLKPLNDVNNLVYFLSNINDRESSALQLPSGKDQIDVLTFPLTHRPRIRDNKEAVQIIRIEMKSPYVVDLIITGAPYLIEVMTLLLNCDQDKIENELISLFEKLKILSSYDIEQKRKVAKRLIFILNCILGFASIKISN